MNEYIDKDETQSEHSHEKESNRDLTTSESTNEEYSSWAIGSQLTPKLKPRPHPKPQTEKNAKRDFLARRRKNLRDDFSPPAIDFDNQKMPPTINQNQVLDLTATPWTQPTNAPSNQNIIAVNYDLQKAINSRPTPSNKRITNQSPKWTKQSPQIRIKCKSLHANPNKQSLLQSINQKLQQLMNNQKIQQFHPHPQGFKISLHPNANLHFNPHKNELILHHLNAKNAKLYVNIAKELDIFGLDISEANIEEQNLLYLEGQRQRIEIKGLSLEREEELARLYASRHLMPGFSAE